MHISTFTRWKSFRLMTVLGALVLALGAAAALFAIVSPAMAANLARQPDLQVAVFIVPLTLLIAALLFEVARFVWRGKLPAETPAQPIRRAPLTPRLHMR